jgi:hypothetical protein
MKPGRGDALWFWPRRRGLDLTACEAERSAIRDICNPNLKGENSPPHASMPQSASRDHNLNTSSHAIQATFAEGRRQTGARAWVPKLEGRNLTLAPAQVGRSAFARSRPLAGIPADATTVRNDPNREHSAGKVELVLTALLRQSLFARR